MKFKNSRNAQSAKANPAVADRALPQELRVRDAQEVAPVAEVVSLAREAAEVEEAAEAATEVASQEPKRLAVDKSETSMKPRPETTGEDLPDLKMMRVTMRRIIETTEEAREVVLAEDTKTITKDLLVNNTMIEETIMVALLVDAQDPDPDLNLVADTRRITKQLREVDSAEVPVVEAVHVVASEVALVLETLAETELV